MREPDGLGCDTAAVAQLVHTEDAQDTRLDDFRDLSAADRRPDRPGGRGLVIAEGAVVIRRLLSSPFAVRAVLGRKERVDELAAELAEVDVPAYVTSAETMAAVVGFHLNRGVLAVADRVRQPSVSSIIDGARSVAVLEGVGDHENLGSLFRNAAAFGVDGVLLGAGCADPLYRRSVRVSMGHVLRVPFASLREWPSALDGLRASGMVLAALTPGAHAVPLGELRHRAEKPVGLMLGSEGPGLSEHALAAADLSVRIPISEEVDSLNVATAAAIAFYELGTHR